MARPTKHKIRYQNSGRPTVMTLEVLTKLEDGFMNGLSDERACAYAGISPMSLYRYEERNPAYSERKAMLKLRPDILATSTVVKDLEKNVSTAQWWMSKRIPEFKDKSHTDNSVTINLTISPALQAGIDAYRAKAREMIVTKIKEIPA